MLINPTLSDEAGGLLGTQSRPNLGLNNKQQARQGHTARSGFQNKSKNFEGSINLPLLGLKAKSKFSVV